MPREQHSKLAVVTVLVLLSFTALDLLGDVVAYPFCASDLAPESSHTAETADSERSEGDSIPSDVHIDDCFCCSRCVNYSDPVSFPPGTKVAWHDDASPVSFVLLLPHELFRPPRLSY